MAFSKGIVTGLLRNELDLLAFSDIVGSKSWHMTPSLADIKHVMNTVGLEKTILSLNSEPASTSPFYLLPIGFHSYAVHPTGEKLISFLKFF